MVLSVWLHTLLYISMVIPISAQWGGAGAIVKKMWATQDKIKKGCELFPSAKLKAIFLERTVPHHSNYKDPNNMDTCLFKVSDVMKYTKQPLKPNYLSDHFSASSFVSPDNAPYFRISPTLIECLEAIRDD
eukprot:385122_1